MAQRIGFFKKIKLYFIYRRLLKNNLDILQNKNYNLRLDYVNRLYTVLNLPQDVEIYGNKLVEKHISDYISNVDKLFTEIHISEYVGLIDIKQETDMDYLIVFGFKFMDTASVANRLLLLLLSIPTIWILISIFL